MRFLPTLSILCTFLCASLAACGGDDSAPADASGDTSIPIDSSSDSAADGSTDAIVDASGDAPDCSGAVEDGACSTEGAYCGGPCTDVCSFCNILACTGGTWMRMEAFPAPCFACGDSLRCQTDEQYCMVTVPGVPGGSNAYECVDPPAACADDLSCTCISGAGVEGTCAEGGAGEVTVTFAAP